jgi:hypothetical protein
MPVHTVESIVSSFSLRSFVSIGLDRLLIRLSPPGCSLSASSVCCLKTFPVWTRLLMWMQQ